MPVLESAVTGLARAVATHAATQWLAARRDCTDSSRELSELLATSFRDRLVRRKVDLQLQSVATDIAGRVERLFEADGVDIPEHESAAALAAVARTFDADALTDERLLAVDGDPAVLVRQLRPVLATNARTAGLSEAAERLADADAPPTSRWSAAPSCGVARTTTTTSRPGFGWRPRWGRAGAS